MATVIVPGNDVPAGYQQITSLSGSTGLTVPAYARFAIIEAETQSVRWRDDGVAPTASVGSLLPVQIPFVYTGGPQGLTALRFIETTASAKLNVSFYA